MKIVKCTKECNLSLNFIDENDNFVGFDVEVQCCEYCDYAITESEDWDCEYLLLDSDLLAPVTNRHDGYNFCTNYFVAKDDCQVTFKLEKEGEPDLYLHLFNMHNGYYAHGFKFVTDCMLKVAGEI